MLGLPTGEIFLQYNDDTMESIEMTDESNPRKYIMNDKFILKWVQKRGYQNIKSIVYKYNNKKTVVSMVDYYAEHGQELEGK